jgi:hypothetical protein
MVPLVINGFAGTGSWTAEAAGGAASGACANTGQAKTIMCAARASPQARIIVPILVRISTNYPTGPLVALTRMRSPKTLIHNGFCH